MAVEKVITIKADTNQAQKSFEELGNIIQEQTDITIQFEKELQELEQQLKDTPKGSLAAQKELKDRIVGLKGALKDQKVSLKSLNNEQSKSNKLNKTGAKDVLDNGGAIALLDTVTGGMASRTRDAFEATKLFNLSLKGTRKALIATGVGAFVVALGLIIAYWDDIIDLISGASKKLQKQIDLGKERIDDLSFELEILEIQKKTLDAQGKSTVNISKQVKETLETQLLQTEAQLEILRSQLEIEQSKAAELSTWQKLQIAAGTFLGTITIISDEEKERIDELQKGLDERLKGFENIKLKLAEIGKAERDEIQKTKDAQIESDDFFAAEADKAVEKAKLKKEKEAKEEEDRAKKAQDFIDKINEDKRTLDAKTREDKLKLEQERAQEDLDNLILTETEKQEAQTALNNLFFEKNQELKLEQDEIEAQAKLEADEKKLAEDKRIADESIALKERVTESSLRALDIAAELAGKETALGKVALLSKQAIATKELLIDLGAIRSKATKSLAVATMEGSESTGHVATGLAATLALGFPAAIPALVGYAAAAIGIVTGVVGAVKGTKKTAKKFGASGSGGDSAPPRAAAPSFNLVQGTGSNQIAEGIQEQDPVQAFVVSSDVTSSQELDRNITENASL